MYDQGFEDSGEPFDDGFYYQEEDDEDEAPRRGRSHSNNPLDGLTPDQVAAAVEGYIDNNPDKKSEIKGVGMRIARKIL